MMTAIEMVKFGIPLVLLQVKHQACSTSNNSHDKNSNRSIIENCFQNKDRAKHSTEFKLRLWWDWVVEVVVVVKSKRELPGMLGNVAGPLTGETNNGIEGIDGDG